MHLRSKAEVSVAMATFNGAAYIREQLDSLAAQTMLPCELVVTDDGSTDATLEILEEFAATAPFPVIVHRNETRLGYGWNFLKAAGLCSGELVAFCDQDDVWLPSKIAKSTALLADRRVLLLMHSAALMDSSGAALPGRYPAYQGNKKFPSHIFFLWDFEFSGCTMIVRREVIAIGSRLMVNDAVLAEAQLSHAGSAVSHDRWIYFLSSVMGSMLFSDQGLIKYRRHRKNASEFAPRLDKKTLRGQLSRGADRRKAGIIGTRRLSLVAAARARILRRNVSIFPAGKARELAALYDDFAVLFALKYLLLKAHKISRRFWLLGQQLKYGRYVFTIRCRAFLSVFGQSAFYCFAS